MSLCVCTVCACLCVWVWVCMCVRACLCVWVLTFYSNRWQTNFRLGGSWVWVFRLLQSLTQSHPEPQPPLRRAGTLKHLHRGQRSRGRRKLTHGQRQTDERQMHDRETDGRRDSWTEQDDLLSVFHRERLQTLHNVPEGLQTLENVPDEPPLQTPHNIGWYWGWH